MIWIWEFGGVVCSVVVEVVAPAVEFSLFLFLMSSLTIPPF